MTRKKSGPKQDSIFKNNSRSIGAGVSATKVRAQYPTNFGFGEEVTKFSSNKFNELKERKNNAPMPDLTRRNLEGNNIFGMFPRANSGLSGFDTPRMMTRQLSNSLIQNPVADNDNGIGQLYHDPLALNTSSKRKSSRKVNAPEASPAPAPTPQPPKSKSNAKAKKKDASKETRWKKEDDRK